MACKLWPGLADKASERAAASAASLTRPGRWAAFRSTLAGADHRVVQPWIGCVQAPVLVVIGEAGPDWKGPFGGGPVGRIQLRRCRHGHSPRRRPRPDVGKARRCGRALASAFWAESAGMVRRRSEIMLVADTDHARPGPGGCRSRTLPGLAGFRVFGWGGRIIRPGRASPLRGRPTGVQLAQSLSAPPRKPD